MPLISANTCFFISAYPSLDIKELGLIFLDVSSFTVEVFVSSAATFSAASIPWLIPWSTDKIPKREAKSLALKKPLLVINFSKGCLASNSLVIIVFISDFIDWTNSCLVTFLLLSSAIGSYKALVLLSTKLSTVAFISAPNSFSSLCCLGPLIGSNIGLPCLSFKTFPSESFLYLLYFSANLFASSCSSCISFTLSWANWSCSGVSFLPSSSVVSLLLLPFAIITTSSLTIFMSTSSGTT